MVALNSSSANSSLASRNPVNPLSEEVCSCRWYIYRHHGPSKHHSTASNSISISQQHELHTMQCISLILVLVVGAALAAPLTNDNSAVMLVDMLQHDVDTSIPWLEEVVVPRERRSTQPGAPSPGQQGGGNNGQRGGVDVGVQRRPDGTNVNVNAQHNVYRSPNGRTTVDAHGNYDRTFGGPGGASRPNYGAGVRLQHKW